MLKSFIFCLLFCLLFSSCQSDLENQSFINLQDEYELIISQELSEDGGLAALNIRTIHELECSNYAIPYQLDLGSQDIKVVLNKVSLEAKCIALGGYISQKLNFDFHNNEKNISISIQDIFSNSGKIVVTDDQINLALTTNDGIKISKTKINRIKKGLMWGSIQSGTPTSVELIKELFLSVNNGKSILLGDYGLFYVNNLADLQLYDSEVNPIETFILFSDSKIDDVQSKIQQIKENDPTLVFKMTLFDGQTINVQ